MKRFIVQFDRHEPGYCFARSLEGAKVRAKQVAGIYGCKVVDITEDADQ